MSDEFEVAKVPPPKMKFVAKSYEDTMAALVAKKAAKQKALANLTPLPKLTEDEWAKFEGKARWDSIVGLRGPDLVNSSTLKWFTSSVIRHKMSGIMRVGGLVNSTLPFVVLPELYSEVPVPRGRGGFDWHHFADHVREAADWLDIPKCEVPGTVWATLLTSNNMVRSAFDLIKVAPEPYKAMLESYIVSQGFSPDINPWSKEEA